MKKIYAIPGKSLSLGRLGENERTQIVFPVTDWLEEYPDASIVLFNKRPKESTEYPVVISGPENGEVFWTVGNTELAIEGDGECMLQIMEDSVVAKSANWRTKILPALTGADDPPEPWESLMDDMAELVGQAQDAAEDAADAKTAAETAQGKAEDAQDAAEAAQAAAEAAQEAAEDAAEEAATAGAEAGATAGAAAGATAGESAGATAGAAAAAELIDDTAGVGDTNKVVSANKYATDHNDLLSAIGQKYDDSNLNANSGITVEVDTGTGKHYLIADVQQSDITNLQQNKADIIISSASGSIASISDGADDLPIDDMVVQIEPVQSGSGDPSPDNVRPISGWTGANISRCGKNIVPDYAALLSKTGSWWGSNWTNLANFINALPVGTYSIRNKYTVTTLPESGSVVYGRIYIIARVNGANVPLTTVNTVTDNSPYVGKTYTESGTFTITEEVKGNIDRAYLYCDSSVHTGSGRGQYTCSELQIEVGSTVTDYEPYSETVYAVNFESAGTVYGGTVNPVTGKLIANYIIKSVRDFGSWYSFNSDGYAGVRTRWTPLNDNKTSLRCSHYAPVVSGVIAPGQIITGGWYYNLALCDPDHFTTQAELFAYADAQEQTGTPVQIGVPLAEPLEYDLTPTEIRTLLGSNAIWADTGDVSVDYRADTRLYVERMSASGGITVDTALSSTSTNPVQNKVINTALAAKEPKHNTVSVSGTTPTISGVADTRYICGECSTLTIVAPASGCIDVTFTSGSTPTVLTVNSAKSNTSVKWANGFDPAALEANTTYEINILDGCLGVAGSWT